MILLSHFVLRLQVRLSTVDAFFQNSQIFENTFEIDIFGNKKFHKDFEKKQDYLMVDNNSQYVKRHNLG